MRPAKIAFAGSTATLLSYCSDIRNIQITRQSTGKYTVKFLTPCSLDESKVVYPIINVTCQSPTGTGTVVNVLNPTATYQPKNEDGYNYLVSFQIETINLLQALPVLTIVNILALLSGLFLIAFVDRPVVMVSCELQCCKRIGCK